MSLARQSSSLGITKDQARQHAAVIYVALFNFMEGWAGRGGGGEGGESASQMPNVTRVVQTYLYVQSTRIYITNIFMNIHGCMRLIQTEDQIEP